MSRPFPAHLRLPLAAVLASLLVSSCASAPSRPAPTPELAAQDQPWDVGDIGDTDDLDDLGLHLGGFPTSQPVAGVRKLGDNEMDCAELYAEAMALEQSSSAQKARFDQAQADIAHSQEQLMKQSERAAASVGVGVVSSGLLSMVPGGSMVANAAMSAATGARAAAVRDSTNKMMQSTRELSTAGRDLEYANARRDHLTDLFLNKGCKVSDVQSATDAPAAD